MILAVLDGYRPSPQVFDSSELMRYARRHGGLLAEVFGNEAIVINGVRFKWVTGVFFTPERSEVKWAPTYNW